MINIVLQYIGVYLFVYRKTRIYIYTVDFLTCGASLYITQHVLRVMLILNHNQHAECVWMLGCSFLATQAIHHTSVRSFANITYHISFCTLSMVEH
jgi:hypothetical protein